MKNTKMKRKKSFLPKKIKIGGFDYKIIFVERFVDHNNSIGLCVSPRTCIYISEYDNEFRIVKPKLIQTLLHEIFHGIDNVYCGSIFEEKDIVCLENLWFSVLADNDFYINDKKHPDSIRVLGQTYKISYSYDFELDERNTVGSHFNLSTNEVRISDNMDKGHVKMQLLSCVQEIFVSSGFFNHEFPCLQFSQGLYQVLKDNKLDAFIRRYCK